MTHGRPERRLFNAFGQRCAWLAMPLLRYMGITHAARALPKTLASRLYESLSPLLDISRRCCVRPKGPGGRLPPGPVREQD